MFRCRQTKLLSSRLLDTVSLYFDFWFIILEQNKIVQDLQDIILFSWRNFASRFLLFLLQSTDEIHSEQVKGI